MPQPKAPPRASTADIARASDELRAGRLIVLPTETVYGLGADAFNPAALEKIFALKQRPHADPLIVHVADTDQLRRVATRIPPVAERLIDAFWPGPLTLVLHRRADVPDLVTSGLETVAVRMPRHPIARRLLRKFQGPIAAPSANRFGRISPTTSDAVRAEFGKNTPFLLEGGACRLGLESTIVRVERRRAEILRLGSISMEAIENVLGSKVTLATQAVPLQKLAAPGQLASHYSPRKPLELLPDGWRDGPSPRFPKGAALLAFRSAAPEFPGVQRVLSPRGSLSQAARRLFSELRALDESPARKLFAELVPEVDLGRTINDRLRRAAAPRQHAA